MKFSFDLDGTYLEHEDAFDELAAMLQMSGHEVGILTNREDKPDNHVELGFEPDFEHYLGTPEDEDPATRAMAKAELMLQEGIDIHYDDEAAYFPDYVTVIEID
jgi:hypothetical protein